MVVEIGTLLLNANTTVNWTNPGNKTTCIDLHIVVALSMQVNIRSFLLAKGTTTLCTTNTSVINVGDRIPNTT